MAEVFNECVTIGSIVSCKTCFNDEVQGEVLAYDSEINTILLKTTPTSGKPSSCDIIFVNFKFVKDFNVLKEVSPKSQPSLPSLDLNKLTNRVKRTTDEKSKLLEAMRSGGTVDGQRLFYTIRKTIDEISWKGPNIIVMNQVIISPPYHLENVIDFKDSKESNAQTKAVVHVKKIVEKFYNDLKQHQQSPPPPFANNGVLSSSSSTSSSCSSSSMSPSCPTPTTSANGASMPPQQQ